MSFGRRLFARYIVGAILPYILLALALLSAVLFAQQAARFAEVLLYTQVPAALLGEISAALLPSVLVFTIPTAVLAGIIIGYSRMGSDSEIVAMRAAGVGTWSMIWPVLIIGLLATAAATYIHMYEAPRAARDLRRAAIQGALRKLESPVEPRMFTTEIPGFVIYVRDGNKITGSWGRVFIYRQEENGTTSAVTARSGRIDSSIEKSELVLTDTLRTQLPAPGSPEQNYVVERSEQLRIAINIGRSALLRRLNEVEAMPDELSWSELRGRIHSGTEKEQNQAQRTFHRRLTLSLSPFLFAVLGGAIGIRVRRGGRGVGVLLSLVVVVFYYLMSLLGESLVRVGTLSAVVGMWMATALMVVLCIVLFVLPRLPRLSLSWARFKLKRRKVIQTQQSDRSISALRSGFPSLMDMGLFRTLSISFLFGFISLVAIFVIFTLFEIWRFMGSNNVGVGLVARYLLFLLPLVSIEVFPATILIAVLVTYALLARRREAIAWWASGQSVYRLMVPGLLFAALAAATMWLIQEHIMPTANIRQDSLRAQIRGGEARATTGTGGQWLASSESNRLYFYEFDELNRTLNEPVVYDFDPEGVHIVNIIKARSGSWSANDRLALKNAETISLGDLEVDRQVSEVIEVAGVEPPQVFKPTIDKPSQLSSSGLKAYLRAAKRRGAEVSSLALALQRKYATPFSALVMAFIGIPLALSFGRKGAVIALCVAVGVSVTYLGIGGGFQQLGIYGLLPPAVAAWSPAVIFLAAGTYFLSKLRT